MSLYDDINWPIHHTTVGPISAYPLGFVEPPRLEFMQPRDERETKKLNSREHILEHAKEYVDYGLRNGLMYRPDGIKTVNSESLRVINQLSSENLKLNETISRLNHRISVMKQEILELERKNYGSFGYLKY